jgi:hypothetical protein
MADPVVWLGDTTAERAVANTLSLMPSEEFEESDGTRYEVHLFCGSNGSPPEYLKEFCGAVSELSPGARSVKVVGLYRSKELLDQMHANISAVARRVRRNR